MNNHRQIQTTIEQRIMSLLDDGSHFSSQQIVARITAEKTGSVLARIYAMAEKGTLRVVRKHGARIYARSDRTDLPPVEAEPLTLSKAVLKSIKQRRLATLSELMAAFDASDKQMRNAVNYLQQHAFIRRVGVRGHQAVYTAAAKASITEVKRLPCLKCRTPFITTPGIRICPNCKRENNTTYSSVTSNTLYG